nr:hypothetical protein [Tanacetum cinerariifolium]
MAKIGAEPAAVRTIPAIAIESICRRRRGKVVPKGDDHTDERSLFLLAAPDICASID